ncbi:unnamed protein product [Protopolystoma xenopodis]|uniref:Uncharacterized protein n=1 Tax=Protopolystoma xenopodis TaxID=117903 RepID=A0A448XFA7_9PLAT|nr:unnamed protein product [Protopolystoma xenopodis]
MNDTLHDVSLLRTDCDQLALSATLQLQITVLRLAECLLQASMPLQGDTTHKHRTFLLIHHPLLLSPIPLFIYFSSGQVQLLFSLHFSTLALANGESHAFISSRFFQHIPYP